MPWLSVLPLSLVMAYGDGFWLTSLRGAVGAIERTQSPFASWLRESTMVLPVFVFAVLGALTLALRWFGPVLRATTLAATALMVAVAGTMAGLAVLAADAAYDYHLQAGQLQRMDMKRGAGAVSLLTRQQQASLGLQVHSVSYGAGMLLVTNLVLVGWVVALRGGRLDVTSGRQRGARRLAAGLAGGSPTGRVDGLRGLLAAGLIGSALIHAAVLPEHLAEWVAAAAFFIALAAAELAVAALLAAVVLLRGESWLRRRPPLSAHVGRLAVVAVIAVSAIGIGGSGLAWLDGLGGAPTQVVMTTSR